MAAIAPFNSGAIVTIRIFAPEASMSFSNSGIVGALSKAGSCAPQ